MRNYNQNNYDKFFENDSAKASASKREWHRIVSLRDFHSDAFVKFDCIFRKKTTRFFYYFDENNFNDSWKNVYIDSWHGKTQHNTSIVIRLENQNNYISFLFSPFDQIRKIVCPAWFSLSIWNLGGYIIFVVANFKYHWVH